MTPTACQCKNYRMQCHSKLEGTKIPVPSSFHFAMQVPCYSTHLFDSAGPNKVAFLISNYTAPLGVLLNDDEDPNDNNNHFQGNARLISPPLKTRLYHQEPLRIYLERDQVLSWSDEPERHHVERLLQLANMDSNPQSFFAANSCCIV